MASLPYHVALRFVRWKNWSTYLRFLMYIPRFCLSLRHDTDEYSWQFYITVSFNKTSRKSFILGKILQNQDQLTLPCCVEEVLISGVWVNRRHTCSVKNMPRDPYHFVTKFKVTQQNKRVRKNNWRTKRNRAARKWESHMIKKKKYWRPVWSAVSPTKIGKLNKC